MKVRLTNKSIAFVCEKISFEYAHVVFVKAHERILITKKGYVVFFVYILLPIVRIVSPSFYEMVYEMPMMRIFSLSFYKRAYIANVFRSLLSAVKKEDVSFCVEVKARFNTFAKC